MALTEKQKEYQRRAYEKKKAAGLTRTQEVRDREREYNRKYREEHPEVFAEQRKRMDPAKRREKEKVWRDNNRDKIQSYQDKWREGKAAFDGAKQRAKRKGIEFTITRDYLNSITPTHCPALGIEFKSGMDNRDHNMSIDRIDNTKGYVEGNVIVISYKANRMKSNSSLAELQALVKFYESLLT